MKPNPFTVFESSRQKSEQWVTDVAEALSITDRQEAYRALRSVLHALRDQLALEESAHLAAQLPMLIRGLYFEGWTPTRSNHVRDASAFEGQVMRHHGMQPYKSPRKMIEAMGRVLARRVSKGEFDQVLHALAEPIRALLEPQALAA